MFGSFVLSKHYQFGSFLRLKAIADKSLNTKLSNKRSIHQRKGNKNELLTGRGCSIMEQVITQN